MKLALCGVIVASALGCTSAETARQPSTASNNVETTQTTGAATSNVLPGLTPNGWLQGSVGANVTMPSVLRPEQLLFGPPPPELPPGAQVAVIEGDPKAEGKLFTLRVRMPDGYRVAPHWHFSDEHITVISGNFLIGMGDAFDDRNMQTLPNGGFTVLPARHHHYAMAKGGTEIQIHSVGPWRLIYVNPADNPAKVASSEP